MKMNQLSNFPYLNTELIISQAARCQKQYRSKGRDGAEQAEEGGSQGWTYSFPPLPDVRDVQNAGRSPLCLNKDLQNTETFTYGSDILGSV